VHYSGFSFILNFLTLLKVFARKEIESLIFPSLDDHIVQIRFRIVPKLGV
jgi:hypothetical protein